MSIRVFGGLSRSSGFLAFLLLAQLAPAAGPIQIKPADFPRPANQKAPLGINLEQVVDFSRSMMFTDLIKSARKFGSPDKPWKTNPPVDDHGWPTADCGLVVVADAPIPPGDYSFCCTGHCTIEVINSKATVKNQSWSTTKTTTAIITVEPQGDNPGNLFLSFKNTDHGVQNIRLLRPGYSLKSTNPADTFNKDFIAALAPFSTLRTMDLTRTNGNEVKKWASRQAHRRPASPPPKASHGNTPSNWPIRPTRTSGSTSRRWLPTITSGNWRNFSSPP